MEYPGDTFEYRHIFVNKKLESNMKTHDLTTMLATGIWPVDQHVLEKRLALAILAGLIGAIFMLLVIFGIRSDMPQMLITPLFWLKVAFPMAMVLPALLITVRLSRPGASSRKGWITLSLPFITLWVASAVFVLAAPPDLRPSLIFGSSWRTCTLSIALLSLPTFVAMFWAVKGLAPTRLVLTGAGIGLAAGAQAVLVYVLYCVEMAISFWVIWYALGILMPTVAGALLGPRLLRW